MKEENSLNLLLALLILTLIFALGFVAYQVYLWLLRKTSASYVDTFQMQEDIRKSQVIDVREIPEFDANHILGARNIPFSQFKMRFAEIRKDQPIYLYDDNMNYASRAARILKKNGYEDIAILKGGFSQWFGKTKSNL